MIGLLIKPQTPVIYPVVGISSTSGGGSPNTTLTVALTDATDPVITSVALAYSLVVTNTGAVTATSVTAVVQLDASLAFVSGSGAGWVVGAVGQTVTCTLASLAVGAAPTVTINVTTGAAAVTASSTGDASAANAPAAVQSVQTTAVKLVTRDATSLIRCPANATEWSDFVAYNVAIGTPNFPNVQPSLLWLCQEASGNLADSIDSFPATVAGAPVTYQQPITGWSRLGIVGADAGTGTATSTSASLPNPATASYLQIGYAAMTATPAGNRAVSAIGTATFTDARWQAVTPRFQGVSGGNVLTGTNNPTTTGLRPVVCLYDITNNRTMMATDQEKLAPTRGATTGKSYQIQFGFSGPQAYQVGFFNAAAELTDAQIKALLVALGWTIPWS